MVKGAPDIWTALCSCREHVQPSLGTGSGIWSKGELNVEFIQGRLLQGQAGPLGKDRLFCGGEQVQKVAA
ncbi:MAG: hypothetical protein ACLR0U_23415 [Enterocloster clostridioformis]